MTKSEFIFFLRKGYALFDRKTRTACMMVVNDPVYDKNRIYYTHGLCHDADKDNAFAHDAPDIAIAGVWATNRNGDKEFFAVGDTISCVDGKSYTVKEIGVRYPNKPFLLCDFDGKAFYLEPTNVVVVNHSRDENHADLL
ncbi:MAG TPA: hypothetical protein PLZ51_09670, partial [Aggregatilineales bacterium]|nr:hypothetical protein [Aggregatilineales bacterium]